MRFFLYLFGKRKSMEQKNFRTGKPSWRKNMKSGQKNYC